MTSDPGGRVAVPGGPSPDAQPSRVPDRGTTNGDEFCCPFNCGSGPFGHRSGWVEHIRDEHGVNGPLKP